MKHTLRLLFPLLLLFVLAACTSVPVDPTPRQQVIANAVEDVLAVGLVPVLAKNPSYLTEAGLLATTLRTSSATTFAAADVEKVLARFNLPPADAKAVAGVVNAAWDTYQRRYAEQVGASLRPDVKLFLGAVANGIDRAVLAVPKG